MLKPAASFSFGPSDAQSISLVFDSGFFVLVFYAFFLKGCMPYFVQFVFRDGKMDDERLKQLVKLTGKSRLVLDLSCRKNKVFLPHMPPLLNPYPVLLCLI